LKNIRGITHLFDQEVDEREREITLLLAFFFRLRVKEAYGLNFNLAVILVIEFSVHYTLCTTMTPFLLELGGGISSRPDVMVLPP
jgi:hypothetical protein